MMTPTGSCSNESSRVAPPVVEPKRRGFGSSIIESLTPADLGGTATLSFEPTGVRYVLDAPMPD